MSSEFTVIRPGRLSWPFLSSCCVVFHFPTVQLVLHFSVLYFQSAVQAPCHGACGLFQPSVIFSRPFITSVVSDDLKIAFVMPKIRLMHVGPCTVLSSDIQNCSSVYYKPFTVMLTSTSSWASFLANVNVLRYVCYMRSQFRLSSVCLSVVCCLWRWCTLLKRLNFSAIFFHHTIAQGLF